MSTSRIKISGKDRVNLLSDLATMLIAGIPIMEAIEALETDSRGGLQAILRELRRSLTNGKPLSEGMEHFPRSFDPVLLNTLRAAEFGGTLEDTLKDVVQTEKKSVAFSDSMRLAMIYPVFIGIIFTGIVLLMLTFVIPRISQVFESMRVNLPPATALMFRASAIFMEHWLIISAAFVGCIVLMSFVITANSRAFIRFFLSLPGLRRLGLNIDLARLTRSLGLLLRSGVPLDETLLLTKRVVRKREVERVIELMQRNIEGGKPLGAGLRGMHSVLPPIMARAIETAETTGTLEETMKNLAEYFDEQVAGGLKTVSSMIEPIMLVVIGGLVGGLMVTIIAPIYGLISQVSGQ